MNKEHVSPKKILIVGAGIAGITLAHQLKRKGAVCTLIDDQKNASSMVAAGMVNPMSFRRTLFSWNADQYFDYAHDFYKGLESALSVRFLNELVIRRLFTTVEEASNWQSKCTQVPFRDFFLQQTEADKNYPPFGAGRLRGFWIEAKTFVLENQRFFQEKDALISSPFCDELFSPETGTYHEKSYDAIVFCTGYKNKEQPYFRDVPVDTTKGQTLTVKWDKGTEEHSLHQKCFVLPIGEKHFRVGATYEWKNDSLDITESARDNLLERFKNLTNDEAIVVDQAAGIRPTTPDRKPLMGQHKDYKKLYLFNGLGAKGYLIAPNVSLLMADLILNETQLPKELDLYRFSN
ncbi:MAG: FAD-binding oxidoreductase [Flavobacteriia bacterium]